MKRKTWIKVKRGLLAAEHVEKLGPRVWLYLYMLDQANWETGMINGWTDAAAGEALGMPESTIKEQRNHLARDGYIKCDRAFQSSKVAIVKWVNPREYSGQVYNPPDMAVPEETHTDNPLSVSELHTDNHTDKHTDKSPSDLPLDSQFTVHRSTGGSSKSQDDWIRVQLEAKRQMTNGGRKPASLYGMYVEPTVLRSLEDGIAIVNCERGQDQADWLRDHLSLTAAKVLMCREVRFEVSP